MLMSRDVDPCQAVCKYVCMSKFKFLGPVYACTCCSRVNFRTTNHSDIITYEMICTDG